jgi:POTRA domain, FtsQ-type
MQDYKARRTSKRRPLLRRRFSFLKRKQRREVPKGFRPFAPLRTAQPAPQGIQKPHRLLTWLGQWRPTRWVYAAVALWVLVGVAVHGWSLWQSPLERVRISGTTSLGSAQIVQMAGLTAGMRLSDLDPYQVATRLRQDSRVEAADARRIYPHTVWIDVRERIPDARVLLDPTHAALVDRYNVVIRVEPARAGDLPLVRGVQTQVQPGTAIVAPGLTRARVFLTQAKHAGIDGFDRAVLDVGDPESIVVTGSRAPRLVFPVMDADFALGLYGRLTAQGAPTAVVQALGAASLADFRFAQEAQGSRLYLKP